MANGLPELAWTTSFTSTPAIPAQGNPPWTMSLRKGPALLYCCLPEINAGHLSRWNEKRRMWTRCGSPAHRRRAPRMAGK